MIVFNQFNLSTAGLFLSSEINLEILAIIFVNGSIFSVFNYAADYLASVAKFAPTMVSGLLFVYGVCNIFGSIWAGNLLTNVPKSTIKIFPFLVMAIYAALFLAGGEIIYAALIVIWGILGGVNANITQFWMSRTAPSAPDFANGLFLTSANLGVVIGTPFSGIFINTFGMSHVIFGGVIFAAVAAIIFWTQMSRATINPLREA